MKSEYISWTLTHFRLKQGFLVISNSSMLVSTVYFSKILVNLNDDRQQKYA